MRTFLATLFLASPAAASEETLATFDACVRHVRSAPYFQSRLDLDWSAIVREWRPRADAARPGPELRELLNAMLAELDASHTAVLDRSIYQGMVRELSGRPTPTFGALLDEMEPGRLFVRALYELGPAERAGLRIGDEIVAVEGRAALQCPQVADAGYDPSPDRMRLFVLAPRPEGERLDVSIRSRPDERPRRVTIESQETSGLESGRRSVRAVKREGRTIGVIHLWMVARGTGELLADAIRGELSRCDALVVDLRGRGGLSDEIGAILAPFRRARSGSARSGAPIWRRPVVFLIDERTRSAKEILAWHVREERLGPLVGERTEGAVLGAGFFRLPGDLYLEIGMMEVPVGDGLSLEGIGVGPTHPVARAGPFAAGLDPILEAGLSLASREARRRALHGPY